MPEEVLLNDLCCVCSVNVPKYKCPGCLRRTCSLACSKRHKTQMSCTGRRDPAAPIARGELATPHAFDRDYNYLVGVEREVEVAKRKLFGAGSVWDKRLASTDNSNTRNRGGPAGLDRRAGGRVQGPPMSKRDARLAGAARARKIVLERAPKGIKRYIENRSAVTNKGTLMWTVEWFLPDGGRELSVVNEEMLITDAYRCLHNRKGGGGKRPAQASGSKGDDECAKRQKTAAAALSAGTPPLDQVRADDSSEPVVLGQEAAPDDSATMVPLSKPPPASTSEGIEADGGDTDDDDDDGPPPEMSSKAVPTGGDSHQAATPSGPPFFFLHHPRARARQSIKTVVPVLETKTLGDVLSGAVILEFPTVFVFDEPQVPLSKRTELEIASTAQIDSGFSDVFDTPVENTPPGRREERVKPVQRDVSAKAGPGFSRADSSSGSDSDSSSDSDSEPDSDGGADADIKPDAGEEIPLNVPPHGLPLNPAPVPALPSAP